jgi:integrase/recombinase XerD
MHSRSKKQLRYDDWPIEDRRCWEAAFKCGEFLDEAGAGAHLAEATHAALKTTYSRFLGFLVTQFSGLLDKPAAARVDRDIIAKYVEHLRQSRADTSIAIELHHLRLALRLICQTAEWEWLLTITKRIAARAKRKPQKHHLVTSERLSALGIELMDGAVAVAKLVGSISKSSAFAYRDGLIIALLAVIPFRRRTLAALRIGKQLVKSGHLWALDIGTEDTKKRRALDFPISVALSARVDIYLSEFRKRIPGASTHNGLWVSNKGRAMDAGTIYDMVRRRTREAFGFPVNLHRFRHAAMTFWSIQDPKNVRGAKDLLGHASFATAEKHYIMSQSRVAGRVLARIVEQGKSS